MRIVGCREALISGLLLAIGSAGCGRSQSEPPESPPPKVSVQHPERRELVDYDEYIGWMQAAKTVDVRARVRGYIQEVNFEDGDIVQKGQVLFTLDPRPFQVMVDESLAQARALDAQKLAAEKTAARNRELVKNGAVSVQELEESEANAASYAARIEAAMQQAEKFKLDLEFSRISAEISGRVSRAKLTEGNLVDIGTSDPVLTTIVAIDPIQIYFDVDERSLQRYQARSKSQPDAASPSIKQQNIPFFFGRETDQGYPYEGKLDFADNQIDPSTGTIQLRGYAPNPDRLFVPGSRARVRVPVSEGYQATVVPDSAILSDQDRKYLLVVNDENIVVRRDVQLGKRLDDGGRVILGESVKPDEWVIVLGLQRARINYAVEPVDAAAQPVDATTEAETTQE
jgi:RND family efflux transporter MFP subunit